MAKASTSSPHHVSDNSAIISPYPSAILRGVVAYVEVRTASDNRSAAVKRVLEKMGARVEDKFTDDVTHVIFKEGKKRTVNRALRRKVHLVSVLWVESCKEKQVWVSEESFKANTDTCFSLVPGLRWKKFKSMQPRDFHDEVVLSAEKCEKRRRREANANRFHWNEEITPNHTASNVLVLESQARSPFLELALLSPSSITIPSTPPSMQLRIQQLQQLQEKNFDSSIEKPLEEDPVVDILISDSAKSSTRYLSERPEQYLCEINNYSDNGRILEHDRTSLSKHGNIEESNHSKQVEILQQTTSKLSTKKNASDKLYAGGNSVSNDDTAITKEDTNLSGKMISTNMFFAKDREMEKNGCENFHSDLGRDRNNIHERVEPKISAHCDSSKVINNRHVRAEPKASILGDSSKDINNRHAIAEPKANAVRLLVTQNNNNRRRSFRLSSKSERPACIGKLTGTTNDVDPNMDLITLCTNSELESTNSEHQSTNSEQKSTNSEPRSTNSEHRSTNLEYRGTNSEFRSTYSEHRSTDSELRNNNSEHKSTDSGLRSNNAEYKGNNSEHKSTDSGLRSNNAEYKGNNSEHKSTDSGLRSNNAEYKGNNSEHRSTDSEFRSTYSEHRSTDSELRNTNSEHKSTDSGLRSNNAEYKGNNSEHKSTDSGLRSNNAEYKGNNSEHKSTDSGLRSNNSEHRSTDSELRNTNSEHKSSTLMLGNSKKKMCTRRSMGSTLSISAGSGTSASDSCQAFESTESANLLNRKSKLKTLRKRHSMDFNLTESENKKYFANDDNSIAISSLGICTAIETLSKDINTVINSSVNTDAVKESHKYPELFHPKTKGQITLKQRQSTNIRLAKSSRLTISSLDVDCREKNVLSECTTDIKNVESIEENLELMKNLDPTTRNVKEARTKVEPITENVQMTTQQVVKNIEHVTVGPRDECLIADKIDLPTKHLKSETTQSTAVTNVKDVSKKRKLFNIKSRSHSLLGSPPCKKNGRSDTGTTLVRNKRKKYNSSEVNDIFSETFTSKKRKLTSLPSEKYINYTLTEKSSDDASKIKTPTSKQSCSKGKKPSASRKKILSSSEHLKSDKSFLHATQSDCSHGVSMSVVFDETSTSSSCVKKLVQRASRSSIGEFLLQPVPKERQSRLKPHLFSVSESDTSREEREQANGQLQSKLSGVKPSIVMTSLHRQEQEVVLSVIQRLGGFVVENKVSASTTHLVCGRPRRTLNVLHALSRGCWIVSNEWVLRSLEAEKWLPEEEFEMTDFPHAKIARQARDEMAPKTYHSRLFENTGLYFVSYSCTPPRSQLVALLNLCGAKVTENINRAALYIGNEDSLDKTSIKPLWVLDCIIQQKLLPFEAYLQNVGNKPKTESSPEF